MKTQINTLRSGSKNQLLNPNVDYSKLPKATSHNGHAGSNTELVLSIWARVKEENPEFLTIKIFGETLTLKANWTVSRKSVSYVTSISNEFLEENTIIKTTKSKVASLRIDSGNIIEISNGKNFRMTVCPSLVEII